MIRYVNGIDMTNVNILDGIIIVCLVYGFKQINSIRYLINHNKEICGGRKWLTQNGRYQTMQTKRTSNTNEEEYKY